MAAICLLVDNSEHFRAGDVVRFGDLAEALPVAARDYRRLVQTRIKLDDTVANSITRGIWSFLRWSAHCTSSLHQRGNLTREESV